MTAEEMYQEIILDYYRNPKNFGTMQHPTVAFRDSNPSCGDIIEMQLEIKDESIRDIKFLGKGCAISIASASLITEELKGKNIQEIKNFNKEKVLKLLAIPISGIRLKCALLALKAVKMAAYNYLGENND
ncbi:SUF system NifU family Fe-S cluster assembly protein [Candidatus Woesearchaeota archaeon]|nr:SUF system NifU family Fe-S cluster assembly protein [Candidatus Woesearchaeota archaeon]